MPKLLFGCFERWGVGFLEVCIISNGVQSVLAAARAGCSLREGEPGGKHGNTSSRGTGLTSKGPILQHTSKASRPGVVMVASLS